MSAYLSDHSSISCPLCSQSTASKGRLVCSGLVFCEHCHERMVVSWSGSYVRDPFTSPSIETQLIVPRQELPKLLAAQSLGKKSVWIKFLGGLVVMMLFWSGLYRLATTTGTIKPPSPLTPPPVQPL